MTEIDYIEFIKRFDPIRNPHKRDNVISYVYPDIHKFNPEHVEKMHNEKRAWSMIFVDNDLYIHPGIVRANFTGTVFTKVPYNEEVIVKL